MPHDIVTSHDFFYLSSRQQRVCSWSHSWDFPLFCEEGGRDCPPTVSAFLRILPLSTSSKMAGLEPPWRKDSAFLICAFLLCLVSVVVLPTPQHTRWCVQQLTDKTCGTSCRTRWRSWTSWGSRACSGPSCMQLPCVCTTPAFCAAKHPDTCRMLNLHISTDGAWRRCVLFPY